MQFIAELLGAVVLAALIAAGVYFISTRTSIHEEPTASKDEKKS